MKITGLLGFVLLVGIATQTLCLHIKQSSVLGENDVFLEDQYNYFVTKSGNMVWAGALSLAWHELTDNITKSDIKLNSKDKIVSKLVDNFNTCPFKRGDLSETDYYIKSGYGAKTVNQINTEVKKKFPARSFQDIEASLNEQDIISYAYLAKSFEYPFKFKVNQDFKFSGSSVKGFKAESDEQKNQVNYLYYENDKQFLVKLKTKKDNERVYLLRTKYEDAKVSDIISQVNNWENQRLRYLDDKDRFQMPVVDFDYTREVTQLLNIRLLNQGFQNYVFAKVYEGLKLKVDETGVKVQNEGVIVVKLTATMYQQPVKPKLFVFDQTFWIVLKQQGKHPYLCIKVVKPTQKSSL